MPKEDAVELIDVTAENVDELGFFCLMSRRKSEGYQRKLRWLKARFAEGMRLKMLGGGARGFIEYIPGEYAWRPVNAKGYMFIHCLWVVGKSKGHGYATALLEACIQDAKQAGMHGVAMVTSEGNWMVGKKLLEKHGFEAVDQAPPSYNLMVMRFDQAPTPTFSNNWADKSSRYPKGLTVFRSDQCPYLEDAVNATRETAEELGIECRVVELTSAQEVRELAPSPYGVVGTVYEGELFAHHYLLRKELLKRFDELKK